MKYCYDCSSSKSLDEFSWNNKKKGIKAQRCKPCQNARTRKHYQENKDTYNSNKNKNWNRSRKYVFDYLMEHPCITCGEADPRVLEFDHRDPSTKEFSICDGVQRRMSKARLDSEIAKCDVLCSNCHARKTAIDYKYFTHTYLNH